MAAADPSPPIRIVQVSDTHISAERAYFMDNWETFVADMRAAAPDLIVHSGDISFDGAGSVGDLAFSKTEAARLAQPWLIIPGNHDIGEAPAFSRLDQPIDEVRIARWRRHFGPQWWLRDIGAWRLVGIDTALLASGRPEEAEQWDFLARALDERRDRPVLLFQHMPPFLRTADETTPSQLAIPIPARRRLLDLCAAGGVSVIACGHVHVYNQTTWEGIDIVWAPATSFFNIVERTKHGFNVPRAGYLEWTLEGTTARHRLIEPPLMLTHDVGVWNAAHGSTTKMPPRARKTS
jgi:3',5'-cyclic AMP phosphodiesterase CpdA